MMHPSALQEQRSPSEVGPFWDSWNWFSWFVCIRPQHDSLRRARVYPLPGTLAKTEGKLLPPPETERERERQREKETERERGQATVYSFSIVSTFYHGFQRCTGSNTLQCPPRHSDLKRCDSSGRLKQAPGKLHCSWPTGPGGAKRAPALACPSEPP